MNHNKEQIEKAYRVASEPDYELLRIAYAILDGIPEHRFNLETVFDTTIDDNVNPHNKHVVACGIGWLCMHPTMQSLGLGSDLIKGMSNLSKARRRVPTYRGESLNYFEIASRFFKMLPDEAQWVFAPVGIACQVPDKAVLLSRIRNYLRQHGQPVFGRFAG